MLTSSETLKGWQFISKESTSGSGVGQEVVLKQNSTKYCLTWECFSEVEYTTTTTQYSRLSSWQRRELWMISKIYISVWTPNSNFQYQLGLHARRAILRLVDTHIKLLNTNDNLSDVVWVHCGTLCNLSDLNLFRKCSKLTSYIVVLNMSGISCKFCVSAHWKVS